MKVISMPIVIVLFYGVTLALGVTISGYLSYEGLARTAKEITPILVVFLMTVILIADMTISYFRTTERRYGLVIVVWVIAASVSIGSNFNFLYSNFMRDDVTQATVTSQVKVFRDNLVGTRTALLSQPSYRFAQEKASELDAELDKLKAQISDPLRPGCGEECRGHMEQVERIIGGSITNFAIPAIGAKPDVVADWFVRYSNSAHELQSSGVEATNVPATDLLVSRIDDLLLRYDSATRVLSTEDGLDALPDMSSLSLDIEREANAILPADAKVSHEYIDPTLGRLGEIVYAFENGFGDMPNPMATFMSLFFASIIDILPFFLSFVLFGKGRLEKNVKTGTQREKSGRRIMT